MENKKQFCILCGAENNLTDKFCHKCGESLDQKDDDLQVYAEEKIKDKVKDELQDKATDTFLDLLKKFLNSKAYGVLLSLSIVASTAGVLVGGAGGVNEFSNNVSGMFIDGSVYGMNFSGQEALVYTGNIGIYPGYDANGDIFAMYIAGNTHFSVYTDLTVTGSDGKTLIDRRIQEDESGRRNFCYVVDDLNATVEINPGYVSGEVYETTAEVLLGTDYGIRKFTQYNLDKVSQIQEYYDNGTLKYQYYMTYVYYADIGGVYGDAENFYDEKGRLTLETSENVKESQRTEYTYYDNGDMLQVRQENGLTDLEVLTDINGNVLREVIYLDPGEIGYTVEYTYYDNGQEKSIATYGLQDSPEDMLCRYEEFYEDGSQKLYQDYSSDGTLYMESVYDRQGSGQSFKYRYNSDGSRYAYSVYDFYTDEYGNRVLTKETTYNRDGSVDSVREITE